MGMRGGDGDGDGYLAGGIKSPRAADVDSLWLAGWLAGLGCGLGGLFLFLFLTNVRKRLCSG